jgi:thiamine biosynthesis lipoprotein
VRIGGTSAVGRLVEVDDPLGPDAAHRLRISRGAVATSGVASRLWSLPGGGFGHHLMDPSTGEPAWTGVIQATALAPSALEAEMLAKVAVLSGPAGGRVALARHGGVLVLDSGDVERIEAAAMATEAVVA